MSWVLRRREGLRCAVRTMVAALFASVAMSAHAQSARDSTRLAPPLELNKMSATSETMIVDGKLDEAVWKTLPTIGQFSVVEPDTLAPEKYPTQLRLLYTDKGLYVGIDMQQPRNTLVSQLSARDQRQLNRDAVFITLDSSTDGHYGYWFGVALGDSLMDGTILPERRYASDWDGPWRGVSAVTASGWSAEMFLPWSMMSMPKTSNQRAMGIYVSRKVAHLNERWGWPPLPETKPQFMSVLDRVQVTGVAPVQQYSVFPYASATADQIKDEIRYKAGADIFWRPTTNFQTTATLNPDFGTIEADDVVVNLTAIETFFPEKRLFFVEGKEVFIAAPRATSETPTTMLNTRRIGGRAVAPTVPPNVALLPGESGQLAELVGAAKVTGEIARTLRYGVLAAQEMDTEFDGLERSTGNPVTLESVGRDFGVARVVYENSQGGSYKALGYMGTLMSHPDRQAQVHGIDSHYQSRNGQWQWDNQLMYSDIDVVGKGAGGFIDGRYSPKKGLNHIIALEYYDKKFSLNDVGFMRRNDLIGTRYIFQRRTSDIAFGRDGFLQVLIPHEWNTEGQVVRTGIFTEGFVIRDNLAEIRFDANYFPTRYEDRNSFGNGTYRITHRSQFALGYSTDTAKRFAAAADLRYEGEEKGGHNFSEQIGLTWRPLDRMTTDLVVFHRDRNGWLLHEGGQSKRMITFDAEEWNVKFNLDFFFTARQQFRASLQWVGIKAYEDEVFQIPLEPGNLSAVAKVPGEATDNFDISTVNFQLRYRWEIAPMSDLFVVYNKNGNRRGLPIYDFQTMFTTVFEDPISDQLVVKIRYRFGS
jgi:hypothetical protein